MKIFDGMLVLIDIDNSITDEYKVIFELITKSVERATGIIVKIEPVEDQTKCPEYNCFIGEDTVESLRKSILSSVWENTMKRSRLKKHVQEGICYLKQNGAKVVFCTARKPIQDKTQATMRECTEKFLEENGIPYDAIIYEDNKMPIIKALNPALIIEDSPRYLRYLEQDAKWDNRTIAVENCINKGLCKYRMADWSEFKSIIESMPETIEDY